MLFRVALLCALTALSALAAAQPIAGDWLGVLRPNSDVQLRILLHVKADEKGALSATMDSLDQGATGIPVNSVTLKDGTLELKVDAVQGGYTGKFDAAAKTIKGTWTQGMSSLPLDFAPNPAGSAAAVDSAKPAARPSPLDGDWQGTLNTGMQQLRLMVHVKSMSDGLRVTMDSLDQGVKGIPATSAKAEGDTFTFEVKGIGGSYSGKVNQDKTVIDGTWSQGGGELPLQLARVAAAK